MRYTGKLNPYVVFLFIFLLGSCRGVKEVEIGEIQDVRLRGIKNNVLLAEAKIPVKNPGIYKIKVKEVNLRITVNGRYLGRIISDEEIVIPANSDDIYTFPFVVRISNIILGASLIIDLPNMKNVEIGLKGKVKGKVLFFTKRTDVEEEIIIESFK